jgi:hypothetical protein
MRRLASASLPDRVAPVEDGTDPFPALARAQRLLEPALRDCIASLSPGLRQPIEYHLGFTDASGNPAGAYRGKALRATLAFVFAEAVGVNPQVALPGAMLVGDALLAMAGRLSIEPAVSLPGHHSSPFGFN